MTADMENLILEQLRAIRADLSDLKAMLGRVELNLATVEQQVGALMTAVYCARPDTNAK